MGRKNRLAELAFFLALITLPGCIGTLNWLADILSSPFLLFELAWEYVIQPCFFPYFDQYGWWGMALSLLTVVPPIFAICWLEGSWFRVVGRLNSLVMMTIRRPLTIMLAFAAIGGVFYGLVWFFSGVVGLKYKFVRGMLVIGLFVGVVITILAFWAKLKAAPKDTIVALWNKFRGKSDLFASLREGFQPKWYHTLLVGTVIAGALNCTYLNDPTYGIPRIVGIVLGSIQFFRVFFVWNFLKWAIKGKLLKKTYMKRFGRNDYRKMYICPHCGAAQEANQLACKRCREPNPHEQSCKCGVTGISPDAEHCPVCNVTLVKAMAPARAQASPEPEVSQGFPAARTVPSGIGFRYAASPNASSQAEDSAVLLLTKEQKGQIGIGRRRRGRRRPAA